MEYKQFCKIIDEGEKKNIDFKIRLDVFSRKSTGLRGELAKDICAMANNGNVASYLIVGVSDDGKEFRTNTNVNLTDDNLQDFCKKSIYPPPAVTLESVAWKNSKDSHQGKTFVIIKIGPQKRQIFRIAQDFIKYEEKICYRKNEVWIRRNATSDLATPEEIIGMDPSKHPEKSISRVIQESRTEFTNLSISDRIKLVNSQLPNYLHNDGVNRLHKQFWDRFSPSRSYTYPIFWAKRSSTLLVFMCFGCRENLIKSTLPILNNFYSFLDFTFMSSTTLLDVMNKEIAVDRVRRIKLLPVLGRTSLERMQSYLPKWNVSKKDFYQLFFPKSAFSDQLTKKPLRENLIPTSNEIVVFDNIKSILDLKELVNQFLNTHTDFQGAIIDPAEFL